MITKTFVGGLSASGFDPGLGWGNSMTSAIPNGAAAIIYRTSGTSGPQLPFNTRGADQVSIGIVSSDAGAGGNVTCNFRVRWDPLAAFGIISPASSGFDETALTPQAAAAGVQQFQPNIMEWGPLAAPGAGLTTQMVLHLPCAWQSFAIGCYGNGAAPAGQRITLFIAYSRGQSINNAGI